MSQYVASEYYTSIFKGKSLPKDEIERYLQEASEKIDSITFNRIVAKGFNNLTDFQKEKVQRAVCYQAEYIFENGYNDEDNQDIASYSVLDISVNIKTDSKKTQAEKECMSEMAYDLINKTGLATKGFRY